MSRTTQLAIPLPTVGGEAVGIARVERETGLSKDTLRAWERRYGFPRPMRDAGGERAYSTEQIEKLRLLRRLTEQGMRPGKIIGLDLAQLETLSQSRGAPALRSAQVLGFVEALRDHDAAGLRRMLAQQLAHQGLGAFVLETAAPLRAHLSELWTHAELAQFEVNAGFQQMHAVLRGAVHAAAHEDMTPRAVIASSQFESDAIDHVMLEAVLCVGGALCVPVGSGIPVREIAQAAGAFRADVVAIPVTAASQEISASLAALRTLLPPSIELWAYGHSLARLKRLPDSIQMAHTYTQVATLVRQWKGRHGQ